MKIYLTGAKQHADTLLQIREGLERQGHKVVSSWFDMVDAREEAELEAPISLIELDECHAAIAYVGSPGLAGPSAQWELGYAYAKGKPIFYIGEAPDIFTSRYGQRWT